jgi:3-hydroxymyristoyl/3-hydroxydecanoyl-(acyl carrier protein) dehydratase
MRFILVDRVDALVPGESITGVKNLALSEEVFAEHFPDYPLYPGTLVVEALAQLGGCLVECSYHQRSTDTRRAVLVQIERAKFHAPCRPGDQIAMRCTLVAEIEGAAQVEAQAHVGDQRAVQATLNFRLMQVESEHLHRSRRSLYRTWMRAWNPQFEIR